MQHTDGGDAPESRSPNLPIVGVLGSGQDPHIDHATELGLWLATQDVHLLTGGGRGVMETVSRAFHSVKERAGKVIGILPSAADANGHHPPSGYPNQWIEIPIHTHLPLSGSRGTEQASRNHINILTANVLVALPGSHGTASEILLAIEYKKPLVAFLHSREDIPGLPPEVLVEQDFEKVKNFVRSACHL
jgi:uncharacterized protein (TIGR00725 family)